jgi:transposase InsO family protein
VERRLDEQGPDALLRTPEPINRFPDFVIGLVHRLKATLPSIGKRRIADLLARAGLHPSASTARRLLRRASPGRPSPVPPARSQPVTSSGTKRQEPPSRSVIARYPGHVWGTDLTVVPIAGGFWVPWFPLALPQCWPFACWLLVVVDHYSRALVHTAVFPTAPSARQVCAELTRAVRRCPARAPPRCMITDQGRQFQCE